MCPVRTIRRIYNPEMTPEEALQVLEENHLSDNHRETQFEQLKAINRLTQALGFDSDGVVFSAGDATGKHEQFSVIGLPSDETCYLTSIDGKWRMNWFRNTAPIALPNVGFSTPKEAFERFERIRKAIDTVPLWWSPRKGS